MASLRNVGLIFTGPAGVARDAADRPDWKLPVLVLVVLSVVFTYALHLTPYQAEYQREMLEKYERDSGRDIDVDAAMRSSTARTVMSLAGSAVTVVLFALIAAAALNGVAMVAGGTAGFRKMFTFFSYAMIIVAAGNLVRIPLILAKKHIDVRLSLGAFFPNVRLESPAGLLLGSTDIFALWGLVATVIGFSTLTGLGTRKSAALVVALYLVLVVLQVGFMALTTRAIS